MSTKTYSPLNRSVFWGSSTLIIALLLFASIQPQKADLFFTVMQETIVENGSWFYVLTVAIILIFILYLMSSKYGQIKLGPDHVEPDYTLTTWLSMLFAAGMGIGLMFYGVAEPLMHFMAPPNADKETLDAVKEAMKTTFFHWGLHAWSIYAIVALILAYFSYRHQLPLTLRSALYPIIGDKIYQWPGHVVDIFAVIGTVFGVATSLGLGASQVNSGLNYLIDLDVNISNQIIIMGIITAFASISVATGLDKGIKILSEVNMVLAVGLLLLIFILGPSVFLLQAYLQNIGAYLSDLVYNTFNLYAYKKTDWFGGWTIFYWGWWLAWAPFVGLFIARISRGRTIREFIVGVMIIPTAFTFFWMTIFGNSAISLVYDQGISELGKLVTENTSVALFVFLEHFPYANVLSFLSIMMIIIFFVTSCDSGAMVIDMLCSNGKNDTPLWQRLYWSIGVGVVAAILTFAGGLNALQTMTIVSALPFAIVLLLSIYGLIKALKVEGIKQQSQTISTMPQPLENDVEAWQERLQNILTFPQQDNVKKFIENTVIPALEQIKSQLESNRVKCEISRNKSSVTLTIFHPNDFDFIYAVHLKQHIQPKILVTTNNRTDDSDETYYRAEVHLAEGGKDYDIMGWSKTAIINDIIEQYHKHLQFLHLLQ